MGNIFIVMAGTICIETITIVWLVNRAAAIISKFERENRRLRAANAEKGATERAESVLRVMSEVDV